MPRRFRLPAFPHIHFMAAAPLDAWVRLLRTPGARIGWRYWPRVGVNLALSACVTVMTLPERLVLAPILWWRGKRTGWRLERPTAPSLGSPSLADTSPARGGGDARGGGGTPPPALVILGYYRTGTTHLHNLLACDQASQTPRWGQVLAPQGFVLSWFVLRLFLTAVLPTRRPQDDMAFGPEWPGEDDFALCNWTLASPLPGRVILPDSYQYFRRFHDLERLTPRERTRWRRTQWAVLWKIALIAPHKRLLLKTPPHTARVPALTDVLGGPGRIKFIHLSREPGAVLQSNQRLMRAMTPFHLQDAPADDTIRDRLIDEYSQTERRLHLDAASIPPGSLVRMRYQDLIADPVGELRRAYAELGLAWTDGYERKVLAYLASVREYRSETQKLADRPTTGRLEQLAVPDELRWMVPAFGHDRPACPIVDPASFALAKPLWPSRPRPVCGHPPQLMTAAAIGTVLVWLGLVLVVGHRATILAWLGGIAIGHAATLKRSGSVGRGTWCAAMTLGVSVFCIMVATFFIDLGEFSPRTSPQDWTRLWRGTWRHLSHESTILWTILGMASAFRLGSRRFGAVPGR